jgi:hypothetical protein
MYYPNLLLIQLNIVLGSSPFTAPPSIVGVDVRLLPIEKKEPTRLSSLELLNALGYLHIHDIL